jgi:hypothetical protein
MLLSRKRTGACVALRWNDADQRYRCGAVDGPWGFFARRWISAGTGCDSTLLADNDTHD